MLTELVGVLRGGDIKSIIRANVEFHSHDHGRDIETRSLLPWEPQLCLELHRAHVSLVILLLM